MTKYLLVAAVALTSVYFVSCNCKATVPCYPDGVSFLAVGFSATDMDSMLLVRYKADGVFDSVADTTKALGYNIQITNDTCNLVLTAQSGHDYKIIFPTTGNVYQVTNIKPGPSATKEIPYKCENSGPGSTQGCSTFLISYAVNGNTVTVGGSSKNEVYYLVK